MRKSRILIVTVLIVVAVVVAAGVALAILASNIDNYRPRIQAELQSKLNRPVTIGHLGLRLFPLSVRADGLTIGDAPQFSTTRSFATAKEVFVSVALFSLIGGNPDVQSVRLDQPQIELIRDRTGVWNFSSIGGAQGGRASGNTQLSLDELKINDGQVAMTDVAANQPRSVYDHIDLTLSDFAPGKQFGIELGVHFPGQGKQLLSFKGSAGPLQPGNTAALPLNGHLALEEVSLAAVNRFAAGAIPPATDTVASADADIASQGSIVSAKGDLKLQDTVVRGSKLDFPVTARYDLSDDRARDILQIKSGALDLGSTSFTLNGSINTATKPTNVNLHVATKDSSITELARLAGSFGIAFNPAYQVKGSVSTDITAQGPLSSPQLNGSLQAKQLQVSGSGIAQPVSVAEIDLTLTPAAVRSNTFTLQSGGTAITAAFALSQYATANTLADATLKTDNADIGELLNIAKAYGFTGAQGVSGKLSADIHVQGPLAANQPSAIARITGSGTLAASTLKAQDFSLSNVHADCSLNGGVVTLSPLTADIFGGKESGDLTVDVRPANPLVAAKLKLAGVDTNALLSAVSSMKDTLYGSLAADSDLHFVLVSSNDLARTLNGNVTFNVTNGQLKNVNILNEISRIGKLMGTAGQSGSSTALKSFAGTLNIVNGVASTNNLAAVLDAGTLAATGSMNLVSQALDMHMTAALASGASKAAGGAQAGGILNTVLANNKGELVIPVIVTGTTAHPLFAPDVAAIAKMKLSHILPTVSGNAQGAGGILNGLLGGAAQQQKGQTNQQPDAINSLLNQLGQKKKKP